MLRDPQSKQLIKVGVVLLSVTLLDHPQPLWLVVARLGGGREPWYLLTNEPLTTLADVWAVVLAYARRWQMEICQSHYPHTRPVLPVVQPASLLLMCSIRSSDSLAPLTRHQTSTIIPAFARLIDVRPAGDARM
jgi:hypothetical protein